MIEFKGHISDHDSLRALYGSAIASVSPGYVGLSLTQSLSFGVPMIISRNEPHAPEIEAAFEDVNCLYFETDNIDDLVDKIVDVYNKKHVWWERGESIKSLCQTTYSVERMARGVIEALEGDAR